jgi:hypothetical protein
MSVATKLQIKPGQQVAVLQAPDDVVLDLEPADLVDAAEADAVILFVRNTADLSTRDGAMLVEAARRDALAWVAYPKAGRLGTDLDRDSLNALMVERGVRGVRQIAVDDTWSALRFRPLP